MTGRALDILGPYLVLAVSVCVAFQFSPTRGDFSWSDAPRHAMNGIFVRDFVFALPISDPKKYAIDYYIQYPALTILFYPPLMSVVMAVLYSIFGTSHLVAQASIAIFQFVLAAGAYELARRYLSPWQSAAVSLLVIGAPEVGFWARQVMLDIPAYGWLVWSAVFFLKYLDVERPGYLFASAALLLCALYTKQVVAFAVPVFAIVLIATKGSWVLRRRHVFWTCVMATIALVPLVVMTLKFGQVNVASVSGAWPGDVERSTWTEWTYYLARMPSQLGWPTVMLAVLYLVMAAFRRGWRLARQEMLLLLLWLGAGYLFFSAISLKEPRLDLAALLPLPIFAVVFISRSLGPARRNWATGVALSLAVGTFAYGLVGRPVPYVAGYAEAARTVIDQAPKRSRVLFSGYRDGSFIFNVRADGRRDDLTILRADKLLLRVAVKREYGVEDRGYTEDEIYAMLNRFGVGYVVAQREFWADIPSMAALERLLRNESRFEVVKVIQISANLPVSDGVLTIYRNRGPIAADPAPITLELMGTAATIQGVPGQGRDH